MKNKSATHLIFFLTSFQMLYFPCLPYFTCIFFKNFEEKGMKKNLLWNGCLFCLVFLKHSSQVFKSTKVFNKNVMLTLFFCIMDPFTSQVKNTLALPCIPIHSYYINMDFPRKMHKYTRKNCYSLFSAHIQKIKNAIKDGIIYYFDG